MICWLPAGRLAEEPWTLGCLAKLILEILDVLSTGRFPNFNLEGSRHKCAQQLYANGWSCLWAGFKHDWKARVQIHRHHRSYLSTELCDLCLATLDDDAYNFTNVSETAPWASSVLGMTDYLAQCMHFGKAPSPYCAMKGFHIARSLV